MTEYGEAFWRRFRQGRRGLLWYYATLLRIYRKRVPGSRFPRAVRLVDRLEGAFKGMFPSAEERRAALSFGPEDSASPMSDALAAFVSAARSCVDEMVANAGYIEKELPAVSLPEDLERAAKKICSGLVETRFDVVSELRELGDVDPLDDPKGVQRQVAMVSLARRGPAGPQCSRRVSRVGEGRRARARRGLYSGGGVCGEHSALLCEGLRG